MIISTKIILAGEKMTSPTALNLGGYYHIFNRGNNRENIFIEEKNFRLFMRLYQKYITPIADTYAYCLLRNHFHILIRVKRKDEILRSLEKPDMGDHRLLHAPSRHFSNFFNAYTKVFNWMYQRTGSLFQHPFHRISVEQENYFRELIVYIHQNPQKHGFVSDFQDWPFSSYQSLLANKLGATDSTIALGLLHDAKRYRKFPSKKISFRELKPLLRDDFL
jgi:putative transposase